MRNLKKRFREMPKKKRILLLVMCSVFLVSLVTASYMFFHAGTTSFVISSDQAVSFSDNFELDQAIDTTESGVTIMKNLTITNTDGIIPAVVNVARNIEDVIDSCDNTGDVVVDVEYAGTTLEDGDNSIDVMSGISNVTITMSAVRYSCPQTAGVDLTITT